MDRCNRQFRRMNAVGEVQVFGSMDRPGGIIRHTKVALLGGRVVSYFSAEVNEGLKNACGWRFGQRNKAGTKRLKGRKQGKREKVWEMVERRDLPIPNCVA